jgi:pyruvate dehydrogenase E1 component
MMEKDMANHALAIELPITENAEDADGEAEIQDWILSLEDVVQRDGLARAETLVDRLIEVGRRAGGRFHTRHTTPLSQHATR